MTVVFKLENNIANVRLKEKDSDTYLNDQILSRLWAKANAVKQTPPPIESPKVAELQAPW